MSEFANRRENYIDAVSPRRTAGPRLVLILPLIVIISLFQTLFFKISYTLRSGVEFDFLKSVLGSDSLFNLAVTAIVVFLHLGAARFLRRIFGERYVKTRYALQFLLSSFLAATGAGFCMWFYSAVIYDFGAPDAVAFFNVAVLAFTVPIILTGLLETFYYRGQWQREQYYFEQEKRQMISAKFNALKNQLSPHFVFNSFNTLGALISKDSDSAQDFLAQLSKVYRYILDNKDKDTVSIDRELESVKALLHIQESRHPGAVKVTIDIPNKFLSYRIIPLTLHTLAENVFKHNVLSPQTPINLTIKINKHQTLSVENDLYQKLDVESHGMGIDNLSKRYELLGEQKLKIIKAKNIFRVDIPFIRPLAAV